MKKLLYFSAGWCGPCRMLSPVMKEIADEGIIEVDKIDVDENQELTQRYGVRNIPTVLLVDESGMELAKKVGANPKMAYVEMINENS
jgi:thioredoxin 1